jgi:hypothetical protein
VTEPQGLCLDKGYDYKEPRALAVALGFTLHLRSRGEEAKELKRKPGVRARRWVVERTHGWMNRFRRILIRWEIREDTYVAMLLGQALIPELPRRETRRERAAQ